jgi:hypothetical protein
MGGKKGQQSGSQAHKGPVKAQASISQQSAADKMKSIVQKATEYNEKFSGRQASQSMQKQQAVDTDAAQQAQPASQQQQQQQQAVDTDAAQQQASQQQQQQQQQAQHQLPPPPEDDDEPAPQAPARLDQLERDLLCETIYSKCLGLVGASLAGKITGMIADFDDHDLQHAASDNVRLLDLAASAKERLVQAYLPESATAVATVTTSDPAPGENKALGEAVADKWHNDPITGGIMQLLFLRYCERVTDLPTLELVIRSLGRRYTRQELRAELDLAKNQFFGNYRHHVEMARLEVDGPRGFTPRASQNRDPFAPVAAATAGPPQGATPHGAASQGAASQGAAAANKGPVAYSFVTPSAAATTHAAAPAAQPGRSIVETLLAIGTKTTPFANVIPTKSMATVPQWAIAHIKGLPNRVPWASLDVKGNPNVPWSAMTLDEYYVHQRAAFNHGSGLFRQFAFLAQQTFICREHGRKPLVLFHNVQDVKPATSLFTRVRMVTPAGFGTPWGTATAPSGLMRVQGPAADLRALGADHIEIKKIRGVEYGVTEVALDADTIKKFDPSKFLMMSLDAIVDTEHESRIAMFKPGRESTLADMWTAATDLQTKFGACTSIRHNQVMVMYALPLTKQVVTEWEATGLQVFTDVPRHQLIDAEAQQAAQRPTDNADDDAARTTEELPDGADTVLVKAVMPKTAAAWKALLTKAKLNPVKPPTYGAWVQVKAGGHMNEVTLKSTAEALATDHVVIEWQGRIVM